jgi:hydrogenase maturation protease
MSDVVVIGIGNEFRRDDGAGLAVVAVARPRLPEGVRVVESDGEPSRLLEAWAGAGTVVVADAVRTGAPAGTIHRLELGRDALPTARGVGSSHALGLGEAAHLGAAMGRLPARLVLIGIEPVELGEGPGLSDAVARAVSAAASRLVHEVETAPELAERAG